MRTGLAYTSARILMLVVSLVVLYLCGARGILLLALAFGVSAIASYILLSKQREKMAGALNRRLSKTTGKVSEFRERLEEGAAAEDGANDSARAQTPDSARAETPGEADQAMR